MKTLELAPFSAKRSRSDSNLAYVRDRHGDIIADVYKPPKSDGLEALAIAAFFARAPDMLEALRIIAAGNTDPDRMVEIAETAVARAVQS